MRRWSLRAQLVALGLLAAVGPVLALLVVVFEVEEVESLDVGSEGQIDISSESGVSPWIPLAALVLSMAAVALVWVWANRAVDPIREMRRLTDDVQAGSLDRRLRLDDAPVEVRELGASFDRMLDRLASASDLERRLIEDASHELRTPLAALSARLEIATRRLESEEAQEQLGRCTAEAERMQQTLDHLLSSARTRQSEIGQVDNDVALIARRVVERARARWPSASLTLETPQSCVVGIDGSAVERATSNLVANAIEHGMGAPVSVEIRESSEAVRIVVTDEGPGIPADRHDEVFDRYRGDDHGIGLAIVKQVAEAYGSISIESPVDGHAGARFTLLLRRHPADPGSA